MKFSSIEDIKAAGFTGFKPMQELFSDSSQIPAIRGVYLVLNTEKQAPNFLPVGTGGFFKNKNPNVSIETLQSNWVNDALVVYIGKAGSASGNATLKSRLRQYFGFGQGKPVGHYGGRLIWQLASCRDLVVCWKTLPTDDPRSVEAGLIQDVVRQYGARPFANLVN